MITTKKHIQELISDSFPFNMSYQRGVPLKAGRGRMRRRIPRTVGASDDRLFSVILYGKPMHITKVEFMNPFGNKVVLARNMVPMRAVISALTVGWNEDDDKWLTLGVARVADDRPVTRNGVTLHRLDIYGQSVLFVAIE